MAGALGWGYEQTLDTPIEAIERFYKGRFDFVNLFMLAIFGGEANQEVNKGLPNLTPQLFDSLFGTGKK